MGDKRPKTESEEEEEEEEDSDVVVAPKKTGTAGMFKVSGGPATVEHEGTSEFKTTGGEMHSSSSSHFESSSATTKTETAPAPVPASAAAKSQHTEEVSSTTKIEQKSASASSAQAASAPVPQPEKKQEVAPVPQPEKKHEAAPVPQPEKKHEAAPVPQPAKKQEAAPVPKPGKTKAPLSEEEEEEEDESEVTPPVSKPKAAKVEPAKAPEQKPKPAEPARPQPKPQAAPPPKPATISATAQSVYQEGTQSADVPQPSKVKHDQQGLFTQDAQQVLLPAPTPTHHSIKEFAPKMEVEGPHKGHPEHAFTKAGKEQVSHIRSEWGAEKENQLPSEPKLKVQLQEFSPYTHDTTTIPTGEAVFAKSGVGKLGESWPPPPSGVPRTSIFGDAKKRTKMFDGTSWIHGDHLGGAGGNAPWSQSAGKIGQVWPPPESHIVRQEIAPTIIRTEEVWQPAEGPVVQRSWPGGQVPVRMKPRQWPPPTPEEIYQMQLEQLRQQQEHQQQQQQQIPAQTGGGRSGKR